MLLENCKGVIVLRERGDLHPVLFHIIDFAHSIMVTLFSFLLEPPQSLALEVILFHPTPLLRLSIFIQAYTQIPVVIMSKNSYLIFASQLLK